MKRLMLVANILIVAAMLLSACATPTPEVIKEVVTQIVKETVKETVIVEGTPQVVEREVTKIVEKEVTKIVEKEVEVTKVVKEEVVVTATPGPVKGGTLTLAYPEGAIRDFCPYRRAQGIQTIMYNMTLNRLVAYNEDWSEIGPDVAESWELSDDKLTWTANLRDDMTYADGSPIVAEDFEDFVHKTLLTFPEAEPGKFFMIYLEGAEAFANGESDTLPGVEVVDDHTIRFHFTQPVPNWMHIAGMTYAVPKHLVKDLPLEGIEKSEFFHDKPVGSGPFQVAEVVHDNYIVLERNPNYWGDEPYLDKIVMRLIPEETTIGAALEAGEVDVGSLWVKTEIPRLAMNPDLIVETEWSATGFGFILNINNENPNLSDPRLRKALLYSIDRDALADKINLGMSKVQRTHFDAQWCPDGLETYDYDPEKATALLEEMGWDSDTEIEFMWITNDDSPVQPAIIDFADKVGIKLVGRPVDPTVRNEVVGYAGDVDKINYQILFQSWGYQSDPGNMCLSYMSDQHPPEGSKRNPSRYTNPKVDELCDKGLEGFTVSERQPYYQDVCKILNEDMPSLPMFRDATIYVKNRRVHGGTFGYGPAKNVRAELWWVEP